MFPITQAEQAGWQRRDTAVLAAILDTHRDLPVIVWTVWPAGAMLSGRIAGPGSAAEVRALFHDWRSALCLAEHSETVGGSGICYLRAVGRRDRVRLSLTATVFDDDVVEQV
jgi:hypothetical protein